MTQEASPRLRVGVIGGSLGGLFAGVALRQAGFVVDVYERSDSSLGDKGAGLRMQDDMVARLEKAGIPIDASAVTPRWFRYLGPDNTLVHQEPTNIIYTSWNRLYHMLLEKLDPVSYHLGKNACALRPRCGGGVDIDFADGSEACADVVVGADGLTSSVRQWVAPLEVPRYAGYVCWRGMAQERDLSPVARELLSDAGSYVLLPNGHMAAYPIPGKDGSLVPGERAFNYVWYRNLPESAMRALLVDRSGVQRQWSIPAGQLKDDDLVQLHAAARRELPGAAAEVVCAADSFIQVIVDVEVSRMVHGRICLMGDSAFSGRPHLGAGTAKAASDAWSLAEELSRDPEHIDAALARWQARQLPLGQGYVSANRQLGHDLQVAANVPPQEFSSRMGWARLVAETAAQSSLAALAAPSLESP